MPMIKKENRYLIVILLIILCVYQYGIQKICGFTLYPDEFGYWASAAKIIGYDWSEIASLGSYYSFGYSLILTPILKLFSGAVTAYRAAIAVNMFLMCISTLLVLKIIQKMCLDIEPVQRVFLSGIAVLYPPWIFYMQTTMAEALLCFLFTGAFYLLLCFMEKPGVLKAIMLALLFVYMYCVHMRTLAAALAGTVILFGWGLSDRSGKKTGRLLLIFLVVLFLSGWIAIRLKEWTISEVFTYAERETLFENDYAAQWKKLQKILTLQGIYPFLQEVLGKLFYLGIASFGIFYWALGCCIKESAGLIRRVVKNEIILSKQWGALFMLFVTVGEVLISSIFMYQVGKVDGLIYGRYDEFLVPVMIVLGIAAMRKTKFLFPGTLFFGVLTGGIAWMALNIAERNSLTILRGYHIAGVSYLIQEENLNNRIFFRDTWILGFSLMLLVCFLVWISRGRKEREWQMAGILLLEIMAGLQISHHYIYPVNNANFESRTISETIEKYYVKDDSITYLDEGNPEFVDFLQMQLPEKIIHVVKKDKFECNHMIKVDSFGKFLITCRDTKEDEILSRLYEKKITANVFCLYYNRE